MLDDTYHLHVGGGVGGAILDKKGSSLESSGLQFREQRYREMKKTNKQRKIMKIKFT